MGKKHSSRGLWDMKTMLFCSILMFFLGGLATSCFYRKNHHEAPTSTNVRVTDMNTKYPNANTNTNTQVFGHQRRLKRAPPSLTDTCDLFSGKWVHDNKSHYPLYKEDECPFLNGDLACLTYGRKDSKYQQWRWQPHDCDFPTFDGKAVVERLRGKRLLFVGDSINRNQWDSMICMLQSSIPGVKKVDNRGLNGTLYSFQAAEYNISVDYYWAPMLVESNGDDPYNHRPHLRAIRSRSIKKHAKHWVNADIIIFNSCLWWRLPTVSLLKSAGSVMGGANEVFEVVDSPIAYKMALQTWSKWTEPAMDERFPEIGTDPNILRILESSLSKLKSKGVNVQMINITQLTQRRRDAHPTVYRKLWRPFTEEQKKNPHSISDCAHWCLPGVPDIWNELLLAYIFR
ncbi:PC-Esterase [Cynara cardunculus var. scolymus]|uniref:PC-Esterase n=1 Tax=Cynara cardunculus var. scolymus TaxID=59895 RepID=A0A118JWU2_CYNCS|nr:PC-Esterase [Cynara cardunculus var. scolymus]